VLERFGKFSRVLPEGLRFRIPLLESIRRVDNWGGIANKKGFLIELTEQHTNTPARTCHTKDNVPVSANASVYWRITDPVRSLYEVDILPQAVCDVALNALRSNIGTMNLDSVLSERASLNGLIGAQLSETGKKWGVIFTRVEIQEIATDANVSTSMIKQMDAERRRRAIVAEAEGEAEAKIKLAESEKKAQILRAEGEATAIARIAEADVWALNKLKGTIDSKEAVQILIAQKYISGFEIISRGNGNKVFLPNSFQGLMTINADDVSSSEKNAT
jgi:regulator of protease activity HflC (stomatin/prohibitin superfamily)